jgi:hypothetical protein
MQAVSGTAKTNLQGQKRMYFPFMLQIGTDYPWGVSYVKKINIIELKIEMHLQPLQRGTQG